MQFLPLSSLSELDQVLQQSYDQNLKAVAIFKHSTRCSISSMALARLERSWGYGEELPLYKLDLIEHRDVSNEIATRTKVMHESPQLIIVKAGDVIEHTSHMAITGTVNALS